MGGQNQVEVTLYEWARHYNQSYFLIVLHQIRIDQWCSFLQTFQEILQEKLIISKFSQCKKTDEGTVVFQNFTSSLNMSIKCEARGKQ